MCFSFKIENPNHCIGKKLIDDNYCAFTDEIETNVKPSRQALVPRTSRGQFPPMSPNVF